MKLDCVGNGQYAVTRYRMFTFLEDSFGHGCVTRLTKREKPTVWFVTVRDASIAEDMHLRKFCELGWIGCSSITS